MHGNQQTCQVCKANECIAGRHDMNANNVTIVRKIWCQLDAIQCLNLASWLNNAIALSRF